MLTAAEKAAARKAFDRHPKKIKVKVGSIDSNHELRLTWNISSGAAWVGIYKIYNDGKVRCLVDALVSPRDAKELFK